MRNVFFTLLFLMCACYSLFGQRIRFYNSNDGLSSSLVRNIESDANGYIWVATDNGLSRYDGFGFVPFRHSDNDSLSVSSDVVNVIFSDSQEHSWVGTTVGLQRFEPASSQFVPFDLQCPADNRGNHYVFSVSEYTQSNLLLVSVSGWGIMAYKMDSYEPDTIMVNWLNSAIGNNFPGMLKVDNKNKLWVYSEMGPFFMIDIESRCVVDYYKKLKEVTGIENISVSTLAEMENGNILVGCYTNGIFEINRTLKTVRRVFSPDELENPVKVIKKDSSGRMWIGLDGGGLRILDEESMTLSIPTFQYYPIDIDNSKVHDIHEDYQGNIWVGLFQKGVICIPKVNMQFEYIKLNDKESSTSPNISCATSVVVDRDSTLWVGSDGGGLFRIKSGKVVERIVAKNSQLYNNAISAMELDGQDRLWVATYMGGISIREKDGKWIKLPPHEEFARIRKLVWDEKRNIMILGSLGYGVMFMDPKTYVLDRPRPLNGWVMSLNLLSNDELWIGRTEGLVCFDMKTRTIVDNVASKVLNNAVVTDVAESESEYWVSTEKGLYKISKTTDDVKVFNTNSGFSVNRICSIQPDRQGNFWISTGKGLAYFDSSSEHATMYNVYEGLQDDEFTNGCRSRLGKVMVFGGVNGLTVFDSETINKQETPLPPIFLSKLTVMNRDIQYDISTGSDNILDTHLPLAQRITLDWSKRMFSLKYGVLEYTNPHNLQYQYRLREFEEDWHTTGQGVPWATYTNLPAGEYTLELKGFRTGGHMQVTRNLTLVILPPWYASWWAWIVYCIAIGALVLFMIRYFKFRSIHQREIAEMEFKENQLQLFTNLSHEIRTPLSLVVSPLTMIKPDLPEKCHEMFETVQRNVNRTLRMINQLIDLRKMNDGQELQMLFCQVDMVRFVCDITKHFEQMAVMRNITLDTKMPKSLNVWLDLDDFDKVVFNLLTNAFSYTPNGGYICVSVSTTSDNMCRFYVENNGDSIDEKDLEEIFKPYFQGKGAKRKGSGLGLYISSQIVKVHRGTIKAENVDKGVRFTVEIPLGRDHISDENIAEATDVEPFVVESVVAPSVVASANVQKQEVRVAHRTIFIVDDDLEWGQMLSKMLKPEFNCVVCSDSVEAWQRIVSIMPDVILSDYLMPNVSGEDLCRRLRRTPETNHIPVIIISSECDESVKQRLIEAGADNYLTKPLSIPLLKSTITHAIHMRDILRSKYSIAASSDYDSVEMVEPDKQFINKVTDIVRQRIEDPTFGVEELCAVIGMSRAHFSRKLKSMLNITPGGLIKSMRLKQAAFLLVNNRLNVSDVAYRLGYSSHSYFTISFREYYGMSPSYFVSFYTQAENREVFRKLIMEN